MAYIVEKRKVIKIFEEYEDYTFFCVLGAPYYQGGCIE
jgi:hypothetical protein